MKIAVIYICYVVWMLCVVDVNSYCADRTATLDDDNEVVEGQCCSIPFVYKGHTYNTCIMSMHSRFWCSLESDYEPNKRWANCACTANEKWRACGHNGHGKCIKERDLRCQCDDGWRGKKCDEAA